MSLSNLLYSIKFCNGIAMSTSSTFSINTPFTFEMQEINGAFFLNAKGLFFYL